MTINAKPVQYKGDDLDPERGPGLGCFRFQLIVLAIFIILTPLTVAWQWPEAISTALLFAVVILLLVTGQTIIFLLRLVAADRRGRRRPLGSATRTVGELEDAAAPTDAALPTDAVLPTAPTAAALPTDAVLPTAPPSTDASDAADPSAPVDHDRTSSEHDEPPPSDEGAVRQ